MFNFLKVKSIDKNQIAEMLKVEPKALQAFEEAYKTQVLSDTISDNLFEVNAKQAASLHEGIECTEIPNLDSIIDRIVNELVSLTPIWEFDGQTGKYLDYLAEIPSDEVTLEEVNSIPEPFRPQLTGSLMKRDIGEPSYLVLLDQYRRYLTEKNPKKRQQWYHLFRQGLDILDIDTITYQIIGKNPNSMGYWLPEIVPAVVEHGFFKIPKTTIIKVPETLLQLTRCEYSTLTRTTLDIVDEFCSKVFQLDTNKEYFIKTGTYSSKFDFRNAYVHEAKEVRELGEYLLYIHYQACMMASPLNNRSIYGVSTTNEWVVREFILDKEDNPCIYKGLPLHTEYRVFVDFDEKQVIGISPYWEPNEMKQRFGHEEDANSPHNIHDYITYSMHENTLMNRYLKNKNQIIERINELIQDIDTLSGQWSVDIMQNDKDFWLIDMAIANNSALYNCVPKHLQKQYDIDWLPVLDD